MLHQVVVVMVQVAAVQVAAVAQVAADAMLFQLAVTS